MKESRNNNNFCNYTLTARLFFSIFAHHESVAQLVEQRPFKARVQGSIPCWFISPKCQSHLKKRRFKRLCHHEKEKKEKSLTICLFFSIFIPTLRIRLISDATGQELSLSESDKPILFKELQLIGQLSCSFAVNKEKGGFTVKGIVSGSQEFACARTLELFERPFEIEVEALVLAEAGLTQQKEDSGDDDFFTIKVPAGQNEVDLTETVRQLIILQEPMIPLKED